MKKDMEVQITLEEFKLIKSFYPEFIRKWHSGNDFTIGWSELMPVVEKIWVIAPIDVREINNEGLLIFELGLFSSLEEVYKAVVEFIKWYNEQNNNI